MCDHLALSPLTSQCWKWASDLEQLFGCALEREHSYRMSSSSRAFKKSWAWNIGCPGMPQYICFPPLISSILVKNKIKADFSIFSTSCFSKPSSDWGTIHSWCSRETWKLQELWLGGNEGTLWKIWSHQILCVLCSSSFGEGASSAL